MFTELPIVGHVTCDSYLTLFADDEKILVHGDWKTAAYVEVPWYTKEVTIKVG